MENRSLPLFLLDGPVDLLHKADNQLKPQRGGFPPVEAFGKANSVIPNGQVHLLPCPKLQEEVSLLLLREGVPDGVCHELVDDEATGDGGIDVQVDSLPFDVNLRVPGSIGRKNSLGELPQVEAETLVYHSFCKFFLSC